MAFSVCVLNDHLLVSQQYDKAKQLTSSAQGEVSAPTPLRTHPEVAFMLCWCAASVKHSFARLVCGVHCPRVSATMTRFVFASSVLPSRLSRSLGCPFSFIPILFRVHSHRLRPLPTQMRRVPTLQPIADLRSACCCGPINCHAR